MMTRRLPHVCPDVCDCMALPSFFPRGQYDDKSTSPPIFTEGPLCPLGVCVTRSYRFQRPTFFAVCNRLPLKAAALCAIMQALPEFWRVVSFPNAPSGIHHNACDTKLPGLFKALYGSVGYARPQFSPFRPPLSILCNTGKVCCTCARPVILAGAARLVGNEKRQTRRCMVQVRKACLRIGCLPAPPCPHMAHQGCKHPAPRQAFFSVARGIFGSP